MFRVVAVPNPRILGDDGLLAGVVVSGVNLWEVTVLGKSVSHYLQSRNRLLDHLEAWLPDRFIMVLGGHVAVSWTKRPNWRHHLEEKRL